MIRFGKPWSWFERNHIQVQKAGMSVTLDKRPGN